MMFALLFYHSPIAITIFLVHSIVQFAASVFSSQNNYSQQAGIVSNTDKIFATTQNGFNVEGRHPVD